MNLNLVILADLIPSTRGLKHVPYLYEFESIFEDNNNITPQFAAGVMVVMTGAAIQSWYADAGKRRKWVRNLDPTQAYAFGVDAFEMEVS